MSPLEARYLAAGELRGIEPAGEMWSVVTLSPKWRRACASLIGFFAVSSTVIPDKKDLIRVVSDKTMVDILIDIPKL